MFHALLADSCLKLRDEALTSLQKWRPGAAKARLRISALLSLWFQKQSKLLLQSLPRPRGSRRAYCAQSSRAREVARSGGGGTGWRALSDVCVCAF